MDVDLYICRQVLSESEFALVGSPCDATWRDVVK